MDRLCCCKQKSPYLQYHLYCSSAGARGWVCALPEAHTLSHLSRSAAVILLLLVILNTALLHRWMSAGEGSSTGVCASPEAQRVPHVTRWAAVHYLLLLCFLIPLRHRWRIYFCTLRARQLVGTVVLLYRLYTTARRQSNCSILLYTG